MRSSNPALNPSTFSDIALTADPSERPMTAQGAANKTFILLGLAILTALIPWSAFFRVYQPGVESTFGPAMQAAAPWLIGGLIGGLIFAIVTIIKKDWARFTAPLYALCEGLFLGGISAVFAAKYQGIVITAVGLTFGVAICMLLLYKLRIVRATEKFKMGIMAATGAIALVYLVGIIGSFFGFQIPLIHGSGPIGIAFSVVVVVIAALNLVLDFDFIETAAEQGAPQSLEWYAAFGLMVTLVWLYLEILRLLAKLRER